MSATPARPESLKTLPRARPLPGDNPSDQLKNLRSALDNPGEYNRGLRVRFRPLALSDDPEVGAALGKMLTGTFPDAEATMFGSRRFPAPKMARWYILWAMAHNGHGRVPVEHHDEVMMAGRLVPEKGFEVFVRAHRIPDIRRYMDEGP